MIEEAKIIGNEKKTGKKSTEIIMEIYKKTILPAMLYNLEIWTHWRQKDWQKLESVQAEILKSLFDMPVSKPYWGMLAEFGLWTLKMEVTYRKLILFHNIMNSKEDRLSKKIIEEQIRTNMRNGWYNEVKEDGEEIRRDINKVKEYKRGNGNKK